MWSITGTYVCTNSNTPELEWPQQDRPIARVIAQQCFFFRHFLFIALSFSQGRIRRALQNICIFNFYFLKIA